MSVVKHILFPVDFSQRSTAVLPSIEAMARSFNAKLTLLHILQLPATWYGVEAGASVFLDVPAILEEHRRRLDNLAAASSLAPESIVIEGDPGSCITAYAAAHGVDLIMMPTHGYGRFRSLLLGSVAAKVLHDAKCAVWTSAHLPSPQSPEGVAEHDNIRNIICAVDETPEAVRVLEQASGFADAFGAHLMVLHAAPEIRSSLLLRNRPDLADLLQQAAFEYVAGLEEQAQVSAETLIADRGVSQAIQEAAEERNADLVIIGRGTMPHTLGRLRTHAYAIIRDSPSPVLSL
jgi:nucleotide-binding universal stress UspA family protein